MEGRIRDDRPGGLGGKQSPRLPKVRNVEKENHGMKTINRRAAHDSYTGREHGRIATFPKSTKINLCVGAMHEHELIIMSSKQACARVTRG